MRFAFECDLAKNEQINKQKDQFLPASSNLLQLFLLAGRKTQEQTFLFLRETLGFNAKDTFSRFLSSLHVFSIVWVYLNLGYKHFPPLFRLNYSPVLTQMRFICSEKTNLLMSGTSQRKQIIKISDVTKHLPCLVLSQL